MCNTHLLFQNKIQSLMLNDLLTMIDQCQYNGSEVSIKAYFTRKDVISNRQDVISSDTNTF